MDLFKIYTQFALKFKLKKMEHYIKRERYLQRLIDRRENGEIKIITGSRRCGKSWLLKKIYRDYLIESGVQPDDIIISMILLTIAIYAIHKPLSPIWPSA